MKVFGLDSVQSEIESGRYLLKLIANESAVVIFPSSFQHCEIKSHGLNYEDDGKGNALAAMVKPGLIEFRNHKNFSVERVKNIALKLFEHESEHFFTNRVVTYRGAKILDNILD